MKNNNNQSNGNTFDTSFVKPEDVILSDDRTQIAILNTNKLHDYCLYNSATTERVTPWVNGKKGQVVFKDLDPNRRYAIRVKKADKDSKSEFVIIHTLPLDDDDKKKKN